MKLKFAIVCNNAFTDSNGRLNIVQTFDNINTPGFPAIHPRFSIVTSYEFENGDSRRKDCTQILKIIHEGTGKEVATIKKTLSPKKSDSQIQYIANFIGLPFEKEGKYLVELTLNKKKYPEKSGHAAYMTVQKELN